MEQDLQKIIAEHERATDRFDGALRRIACAAGTAAAVVLIVLLVVEAAA